MAEDIAPGGRFYCARGCYLVFSSHTAWNMKHDHLAKLTMRVPPHAAYRSHYMVQVLSRLVLPATRTVFNRIATMKAEITWTPAADP